MAASKPSNASAKKVSPAKKPATKTTSATPAKPAATRKKTVKPTIQSTVITSSDRFKMIEVAAYYIAEKSGFGHDHLHYWLQAEQEIDAKLNA